jgi:mono/diheme cytochrome c family protein
MQINLTTLKRWTPFIGLIVIVIIILIRMVLHGSVSKYESASTDPALIYKEACSGCHGLQGKGVHFYIPDLATATLMAEEVHSTILKGGLFMPSFGKLKNVQIEELSTYVMNKNFK